MGRGERGYVAFHTLILNIFDVLLIRATWTSEGARASSSAAATRTILTVGIPSSTQVRLEISVVGLLHLMDPVAHKNY